MVLTFITYIYNPKYYIKFGILHLLGISMIFYHILNQYIKHANLKYYFTAGTIFIITGNVFSRMETGLSFLFPFGLINKKFSSLDFYPVCPWFGVFLYGTIIGKKIYAERKSIFSLAYHCPFISYISHHSLTIYLIHQPILLACLYIIHYIF